MDRYRYTFIYRYRYIPALGSALVERVKKRVNP